MRKTFYTRKTNKRWPYFKQLVTLFLVTFVVVLVLQSDLFNISEVVISGNITLSESDVKAAAGLLEPQNLVALSTSKVENMLSQLPYVKKVTLKKHFPSTLLVNIVERQVRSYVKYQNTDTYIWLDEEGMVLQTATYIPEKLPVVVGLPFSQFSVGKKLETENEEGFKTALTLTQLLQKYAIEDIAKVDVSDPTHVHLFVNHVDVSFGNMQDVDTKLQNLKAVLASEAFPKEARGFLDMQESSKRPVFRYLH